MADTGSRRPRLTIDISLELRRRIKVAAARRDVSVRDYVVAILDREVPAAEEQSRAPRGRLVTRELVERFRQIQAQQRHPFTDDSTDLINEARLDRMQDL